MVFNLDQLDDYILAVKNLKGKFVSCDYEASGLNTHEHSFCLAGIGISDEEEGFYLIINSLESRNNLTEEQKEKIVSLFQWLEQNKVILVYNQSYEINVTKRIFNYDIKVQDVLVIATALDTRGSLKDNTRKFVFGDESKASNDSIDYSDDEEPTFVSDEFWEKAISDWNRNLKLVVKSYLPKKTENKHFVSFLEQYATMRESGQYYQPTHKIKGLNEGYANLFQVIEDELEPEAFQRTKEILFETIISKVHNAEFEVDFTYIPEQIISKYCIDDCINTVKLFKVFAKMLGEGNYKKAFDSYSKQTVLAMEMENNGIAWDENAHQKYESELREHLLARMKSMILNPRVIEALEISDEQILEIKTTTDLDVLNGFINPRSIKTREIVTKVMMSTPVKIAWLLETSKDLIKKQNNYGRKVLAKMSKFLDLPYGSAESLMDIIPDLGPVVYFYRESGKASEKEFMATQLDKFELPGFNKEIIAKFKDIFSRYFAIDFSSWDSINSMPESQFYVDIFLCKKVAKELSSFDSKLGMDCVTAKEDLYVDADFDYLYRGRFNPCAVTTKRFSSQYHTISTNSHIRDCLVSKHGENGILFHTDLSQAKTLVCINSFNCWKL